MEDQLVETWRIHARINLALLDAVNLEVFSNPQPKTGRSVPQIFAHIHNVRLEWLRSAELDLAEGIAKLGRGDPINRPALKEALEASATAISRLLERGFKRGGKVRGFKPHAGAFLGYLLSHEAYHHGAIGIGLTAVGYPLDRKKSYEIWAWEKFIGEKGGS